MSPLVTACVTPATARSRLSVPSRRSLPSAVRPAAAPARRAAVRCFCSAASASPSSWDWNRWLRHFFEVDKADRYVSQLKFKLKEAVKTEDFAEAAKLKKAILEAAGNDVVAQVMSELKSAIEEERYQDASRLTRLAGANLVGWWAGYTKDTDDFIGRIVRITPGVGRYVAKSYSPRELVGTVASVKPRFEIFLVRDDNGTYTMKVVHLLSIKGNSSASSAATEGVAPVESDSSVESSSISDSVTEEANTDTNLKGNEEFEEKEQNDVNNKDSSVEGLKSSKSQVPEFKDQEINVDVSKETEFTENSSEELVQDDVKSISDNLLEEPTTEELKEEDVPAENIDEESKGTVLKFSVSGVVHSNKVDAGVQSYVRVPAEIINLEKDSFQLYIPGKGSDQDMAETKVAKQKVIDTAFKLALKLTPSDVAKALWGTIMSSEKIKKVAWELLRIMLSKARVKLTEKTIFSRIITDTNSYDPFNGIYIGEYSPYGPEIVEVRRKFGDWNNTDNMECFEYVEAVKLTGDLCVPAREITFRAKIGKGNRLKKRRAYPENIGVIASYKGQGRISEPGFKNPDWVYGELLVLSGKFGGAKLAFLYSIPVQGFLVFLTPLHLPK